MTDAGGQQTVPDIPLQRRWIGLGIVAFLVAAMIYFSVKTAALALECGCSPLWVRISLFAVSALVMLPALYLIVTPLHRKWKTGRFLMTPAESAAKRAEYRSKMGARKPFWPQAWIWSITLVWALFFAILGAVAIAGAVYFGRSSWVVLILFLLLAAVALFLPGWMLFKAVQRKLKSGSFLPSQEELDAARARCAKPKSLKWRILTAGLYCFVAILYTDSALRHHRTDHSQVFSPWVLITFWWGIASIWLWQAFRPSSPQCALPDTPDEPKTPSGATVS